MTDKGTERRRFKRIFFSASDRIKAIFTLVSKEGSLLESTILNMSESGLGLMMQKGEDKGMRPGDHLILKEITGAPHLSFIQNLEAEVRWVLNHEFLEHIGFGCEFINLPPEMKEKIRNSMDG